MQWNTCNGYTFTSLNLNNKEMYGNIQYRRPMLKPNFLSQLVKLCIMFFSSQCFLLNLLVPIHTTVNAEYYARIIQMNLIKTIRKKQPHLLQRGVILHQDKATAHKAKLVQEILQKLNTETLAHHSCSPDLAPCDFWLVPFWKILYKARATRTERS